MLDPLAHLAWLAVPLAFWVVLLVVPLQLASDGGWPASLERGPEDSVWFLLALHGGLAAGIAAVVAVSLVKKLAYRARVRAGSETEESGGAAFWRSFTYRWRFDLWLAMAGGILLGTCWTALYFEDSGFFFGVFGGGVVFLGLAVVTTVNFWRAGEQLAAGESLS